MILYYRLSSEHAGSYRQCPLGCSALSLSEVKQLLSERCDLAREYRRKIDFRIFLVGGGSSGRGGPKNDGGAGGEDLTEVTDENQMIHAYSKLVVQRIAIIGSHPGNVLHKAKSELSQEEWKSSEERKWLNQRKKKKRLPPEWLCGICHHVMEQPVLIRCSGNCVQSACASCLESRLKNGSGACPFCKSKIVRQAIRNKRLEEIIRHANLSEYEEGAQLGEDRKGGDGAGGGWTAGVTPGGSSSSGVHTAKGPGMSSGGIPGSHELIGEGSSHRLFTSTGEVGGDSGTILSELNRSSSGVGGSSRENVGNQHAMESQQQANETPTHFVYLLPPEDLKLMREHSMIVLDKSSTIAATLSRFRERHDALQTQEKTDVKIEQDKEENDNRDKSADQGEKVDSGDTRKDGTLNSRMTGTCGDSLSSPFSSRDVPSVKENQREDSVYITPVCLSGGGTSFSIGGFAHIEIEGCVDDGDSMRNLILQRWHHADIHSLVYHVKWRVKYGTMPMLPSRKQPLCNLLGAHRRQFLSTFVPGSVAGLLQRNVFHGGVVEAVVEASKYQEVMQCIQDYAEFGSRPTEPWPHTGAASAGNSHAGGGASSKGSGATAPSATGGSHHQQTSTAKNGMSGSLNGGGNDQKSIPPPPPVRPPESPGGVAGNQLCIGPGTAIAAVHGLQSSDQLSVSSANSQGEGTACSGGTSSGSTVTREEHQEYGIPVEVGPPPLGLNGEPGEASNPYMGYCALLPFLTEEQFHHVRRLQKKAIKLCGYKRPFSSVEGSTVFVSSSEGKQRKHRKRKRKKPKSCSSDGGSDVGEVIKENEVRGTTDDLEPRTEPAGSAYAATNDSPAAGEAAGDDARVSIHSKGEGNHDTTGGHARLAVGKPLPPVPPPLLGKSSSHTDSTSLNGAESGQIRSVKQEEQEEPSPVADARERLGTRAQFEEKHELIEAR